jgi:cytochrome c-type biogenesis protein
MIEVPLAYAFTVGMVAAVNPCGFPMLPAYLSYFIGTDDERADGAGRVPRALGAAAAVSAGFLAVFTALGIPINAGMTSIYRLMPWLTIVIGVGLAVLGVAMLGGYRLKVALPRLDRGGRTRRFGSMFVFGVSYAIASLSCTLPLFLTVVVGTTERSNALSGLLAFGAYALGMSLVLMVLSVALALARESMVRRLRAALAHVDRVAGALLVAVGGYLVYYGVWARDPINATTSPLRSVERWSADLAAWLGTGGVGLGAVFALLVVAGAAVGAVLRLGGRRRTRDGPGPGADRAPDAEHTAV